MLVTDQAKLIRIGLDSLRVIGRNSAGVRLFNVADNEHVVSAVRLDEEEEPENEAEEAIVEEMLARGDRGDRARDRRRRATTTSPASPTRMMRVEPSGEACGAECYRRRSRRSARPLRLVARSAPRGSSTACSRFRDQHRWTTTRSSASRSPWAGSAKTRSSLPSRAARTSPRSGARRDETTPLFAENWHSDWSFLAQTAGRHLPAGDRDPAGRRRHAVRRPARGVGRPARRPPAPARRR